jgi:hypothetical protein
MSKLKATTLFEGLAKQLPDPRREHQRFHSLFDITAFQQFTASHSQADKFAGCKLLSRRQRIFEGFLLYPAKRFCFY